MKIKTVLLDMDGVLVNFVAGFCKYHNIPVPYDDPNMYGQYDFFPSVDVFPAELKKPLKCDFFWYDLKPMSDAVKIIKVIKDVLQCRVDLLSDVSRCPGAASGKIMWLEKHREQLGLENVSLFLLHSHPKATIGDCKARLAKPDTLLIDDSDVNVNVYREAGGPALLVPRKQNSECKDWQRTVEVVEEQLKQLVRIGG